jgi:hypothetical protein
MLHGIGAAILFFLIYLFSSGKKTMTSSVATWRSRPNWIRISLVKIFGKVWGHQTTDSNQRPHSGAFSSSTRTALAHIFPGL